MAEDVPGGTHPATSNDGLAGLLLELSVKQAAVSVGFSGKTSQCGKDVSGALPICCQGILNGEGQADLTHPDLLPQEKEQREFVSYFANARPANPVVRISVRRRC
jgi:hypothetical protein